MESVAHGLWALCDEFESRGNVAQAVKCLEAICQSPTPFLPIIEVKTRLHLATLLIDHTDNLLHAKNHLERAQLLLKQIPSCFDLKCTTYSLLSRCYHLVGTSGPQKQILKKGLELAATTDGIQSHMWLCNFNLQLATALSADGSDFSSVIRVLESGLSSATRTGFAQLQLIFAASMLHAHLMKSDDAAVLQQYVNLCDHLWNEIPVQGRDAYLGLQVYYELLCVIYFLRACDYKEAAARVERLDAGLSYTYELVRIQLLSDDEKAAYTSELEAQQVSLQQKMSSLETEYQDPRSSATTRAELSEQYHKLEQQLRSVIDRQRLLEDVTRAVGNSFFDGRKLKLGPFPLDGEWIPTVAVLVLVDLMAILCARPKGMFKDTSKRIQSGLKLLKGEFLKLGIMSATGETHLQHWKVWTTGVYTTLYFQILESKIVIDLTRTDFLEAQRSLLELLDLYSRFPTILQGCESAIHMLIGHYAHSVGCFQEAALHFIEGGGKTEMKSQKAMCHVYASISLICMGDADSSSQALDLIGPVYRSMDAFIGVREKTLVQFASGLLLTKQHNPQEARQVTDCFDIQVSRLCCRIRLANGLKLTHKQLGSHQLVSQYLTMLGSLALAMHDTSQALTILKSSFNLSKILHDVPAQIVVLSELTALYKESGETAKEMENFAYEQRKVEELYQQIHKAVSSDDHLPLIQFGLNNMST